MSGHGLTPDALKSANAVAVREASTFRTHGIGLDTAVDYLQTPEGRTFLKLLKDAARPGTTDDVILDRALDQLASGRTVPRIEVVDDPLVKVVPTGVVEDSLSYTPYFAKRSEFDAAIARGERLHDFFGLPIRSEGELYDVYEIRPKGPAEVFVSEVAPTSELDGKVRHRGGATQHLVPNRTLFSHAEKIGLLGNDLELHERLVVAPGLGARIAPDYRPRAVAGLGIAGAAATAFDAATTAGRAADLRAQGNEVGAQAEVMRFGARNVGGWAGAVIGAKVGAAVGVQSGPGLVVTGIVGAGVGAIAGDRLADWIEKHRINNQTDRDGHTWRFDPDHPERGWTRSVREMDTEAMAASTVDMPIYTPERILTADAALTQELNFKASRQAVQLRLASPDVPVDPYRVAADSRDTPSLHESPWVRDPDTRRWTREVADRVIDRTTQTRTEVADPAKAAELDAYAQTVIVRNASRTPAAIAHEYARTHAELGWERYGPVPYAVTDALRHPGRVPGSDGLTYERGADGQWTHDGLLWDSRANGNLLQELEGTYRLQPSVRGREAEAPEKASERTEPVGTQAAGGRTAPTASALGDEDRRMLEQLRDRVRELDRQAGKPWDDSSERLSVAALLMARQNGFTGSDELHVAFNRPTERYAAGELVHVYRQGPNASPDPFANRAHMPTVEALSVPVEARIAQIHDVEQMQAQAQRQAQEQHLAREQAPAAVRSLTA